MAGVTLHKRPEHPCLIPLHRSYVLTDPRTPVVVEDLDALIKVLAHPIRRQILTWLKQPALHFPDQSYGHAFGVCAQQIFQRCDLAKSTMSTHLAQLQDVGLLLVNQQGRSKFFSRNEALIQSMLKALQDTL